MSLITALGSGLSGILSSQKAVEVVGNNVANVNTPGYSRQFARLSAKPAVNIQGLLIGQGVGVQEISREYNGFITNRIKEQNDLLGQESAKSSPLGELERVLNIGDNSLVSDIEGFFAAWQDLTRNPAGEVERDRVLYEGENLLSSFEQKKEELVDIKQNIEIDLNAKVDEINLKLREIADLNERISAEESSGNISNLNRDRRDVLVQDLSRTLGVQAYQAGEGKINLQLPGGIPLVQGSDAVVFEAEYIGGTLSFQVKSGDVVLEADKDNFGGEFRGSLDIRDDLIPSLDEDLDELKYALVTTVNARHEAGYGLDGIAGRAFFSKPTSWQSESAFTDPSNQDFKTGNIVVNGTSVQIDSNNNSLNGIRDAINDAGTDVLASVAYDDANGKYRLDLTPKTQGGTVSFVSNLTSVDGSLNFENTDGDADLVNEISGEDRITVTIADTQEVAAAGVTEGAPGDNENAMAVYDLFEAKIFDGQQTFTDFAGGISSTVGIESKRNAMALGGAEDTMTQLENLREASVGVSLEEEIMNLTKLQRGFEACCTFVSTVDEMMSTVLQMKR